MVLFFYFFPHFPPEAPLMILKKKKKSFTDFLESGKERKISIGCPDQELNPKSGYVL